MSTDRIEKQILLRAPLERVWRALADSESFGTWFGMKFHGPFVAGTKITGTIVPTKVDAEIGNAQKPYEGLPFEFTIVEMVPERLLSYRWRPYAVEREVDYSGEPTTLVEFVLEKVADGVLLKVTESGFDQLPAARREKAYKANDQGWAMSVTLIEKFLSGVNA